MSMQPDATCTLLDMPVDHLPPLTSLSLLHPPPLQAGAPRKGTGRTAGGAADEGPVLSAEGRAALEQLLAGVDVELMVLSDMAGKNQHVGGGLRCAGLRCAGLRCAGLDCIIS